jgi:integrase
MCFADGSHIPGGERMNRKFISALAPYLYDFLELKNSLGIKYETGSYYLGKLDSYNYANGNDAILNREIVENWAAKLELASSSRDRSWISPVREFGRYLVGIGFEKAYVIDDKYRMQRYHADVYLMSGSEIEAFFKACDLEVRKNKILGRPYVLPALYRLLYCCGVRCREARNLKCKEVNLDEGYVDILQSKANRDRRLFLSDELANYLKEYEAKINICFPEREYFFPSPTGRIYSSTSISSNFRNIWLAAGLKRDGMVKPRAYDFRHHFACANIIRWSKEGMDIHAMLPYLMRYMGHASLDSTYYYLHLTPDFFPQYASLAASAQNLIPEVLEYEI